MQSKATTVADYLASLPADRRAEIETVRKVIRDNLDPRFQETMQYGMIGYSVPHSIYPAGYHCDPKQPLPYGGLASQKNHLSVYLMCLYGESPELAWFTSAWKKSGRKLDMGKCCIRFKKAADLALDVLGEAIRRVNVDRYIGYYEASLRANASAAAARKAARASSKATRPKSPATPSATKPAPKSTPKPSTAKPAPKSAAKPTSKSQASRKTKGK